MGKPVSLSKVRKARAKAEARARADENAVKFGRSKARKTSDKARADKAARDLDGKRRE